MTQWAALIAAIAGLVTALGGAAGIVMIIRALRGQTAATNALEESIRMGVGRGQDLLDLMARSEAALSALAIKDASPVAAHSSVAGDDDIADMRRLLSEFAHPVSGSARAQRLIHEANDLVAETEAARALMRGFVDELSRQSPVAMAKDAGAGA